MLIAPRKITCIRAKGEKKNCGALRPGHASPEKALHQNNGQQDTDAKARPTRPVLPVAKQCFKPLLQVRHSKEV